MSETINNIIRFNYSVDPTTLMSNSWITNNTDTDANTVTPVGGSYWRTITFDFSGKEPYSGVFRIKVDENGIPDTSVFESISGDEVTSVYYSGDTLTFVGDSTGGECTNFSTATENTVYTETDNAGTWSYVQSDYVITHYWRTITFNFTGKTDYAGVFRIEVDNTGVPITEYGGGCNFVSISGDEVEECYYNGGVVVQITNETLRAAGVLTNFPSAVESQTYTETEVTGTWSYVASTTTETDYDHYEVELYVNSDVTTFPNNLFYNDENITSVEFDTYSITSIEDGVSKSSGAFYDCLNLRSVVLPNNIEYIGDYGISCPITSILLAETLVEIGIQGIEIPNLSITSLATVPPTIHTNSISDTTTLTIHETALQSYINSDWSNYLTSIDTIETPTYNNVLKFNYSTDPTTLLNNLWVNSCTDTSANTIVGVGEREVEVTKQWRDVTYSNSRGDSGTVRIGWENNTYTNEFEVISYEGIEPNNVRFTAHMELIIRNQNNTHVTQIAGFANFNTTVENQEYSFSLKSDETITGTISYTNATTTETITVVDHYEVTLYINSALNTFETTMFAEDTNLLTIDFEYDVTFIGDDAFNACTSLTDVTLNTPVPPTLGDDVFKNVNATLYVPFPSLNIYRQEMGDIFPVIKPTKLPAKSYGFNLSGMKNVDYKQQGVIILRN